MNIIEYICEALQRAFQKRSPSPLTPTDLWTALQGCQLPLALLQTLIESMPRRVAALLCARKQHSPCWKIEFYKQSSLPGMDLNKFMAIIEYVTRVTGLATNWKKIRYRPEMNEKAPGTTLLEISMWLYKGLLKQRLKIIQSCALTVVIEKESLLV
ncbi:transposable element tcb2 transposase [Trichonephila clavipes]|nr:transposable element tcb2 transposase [Trichonephila clavipes]